LSNINSSVRNLKNATLCPLNFQRTTPLLSCRPTDSECFWCWLECRHCGFRDANGNVPKTRAWLRVSNHDSAPRPHRPTANAAQIVVDDALDRIASSPVMY